MKYELPDILEVAEEHNLIFDPYSLGKEETKCKCPFCKEDSVAGKEKKFYLSLNTQDHVFKCWYCKESGGVFRFISLLADIPEDMVIEKWKEKHRGRRVIYKPHPVERLTLYQLRLLGFRNKPDWYEMRKRDMDYYKRTRDFIYSEWKQFLQNEKRAAYMELVMGIQTLNYQKAVEAIQAREKEIGASILKDVLKMYSLPKRPDLCVSAERFVHAVFFPQKDTEAKEQRLYETYAEFVRQVADVLEVELSEVEIRTLCNIIPELDLNNTESIDPWIFCKIHKGMIDKKINPASRVDEILATSMK